LSHVIVALWIDEGDHDVAGPAQHPEPFVLMSQFPRVHDHVPQLGVLNGAVVPCEAAATTLEVFMRRI